MPVLINNGTSLTQHAVVLWRNLAATATITTFNAPVAGYPAANVVTESTYDAWRWSSNSNWIRFDMGSAIAIDSAGISGHNAATQGYTIRLEYSTDDATWTLYRPIYVPLTNEDILIMGNPITARYWRVQVAGSPTGGSISNIFIGARLTFPNAVLSDYKALNHSRVYEKEFSVSTKGQWLGNRLWSAEAETTADIGLVSKNFADVAAKGFEDHYNKAGTFFYAGCPASFPNDVGYCRAAAETDIVNIDYVEAGKLASFSFTVKAIVHV